MKTVLNPAPPPHSTPGSAGRSDEEAEGRGDSGVPGALDLPGVVTAPGRGRLVIPRRRQSSQLFVFPSVRECNAAVAAFGEGGELLRALRLLMKMLKAASLASRAARGAFDNRKGGNGTGHVFFYPPAPTLLTYSTLMSKAVHFGKPPVALRL